MKFFSFQAGIIYVEEDKELAVWCLPVEAQEMGLVATVLAANSLVLQAGYYS